MNTWKRGKAKNGKIYVITFWKLFQSYSEVAIYWLRSSLLCKLVQGFYKGARDKWSIFWTLMEHHGLQLGDVVELAIPRTMPRVLDLEVPLVQLFSQLVTILHPSGAKGCGIWGF